MGLLPLQITDEERGELERSMPLKTFEARAAQRARMILLAACPGRRLKSRDERHRPHSALVVWREEPGLQPDAVGEDLDRWRVDGRTRVCRGGLS